MAINPISGKVPNPPVAPTTTASNKSAAQQPINVQPKQDSVKLTGAALARSMKLAGQTPTQIAQQMGLSVSVIDSYLGIKSTATATTPPPAAAPTAKK